jgi:hypothetical protein
MGTKNILTQMLGGARRRRDQIGGDDATGDGGRLGRVEEGLERRVHPFHHESAGRRETATRKGTRRRVRSSRNIIVSFYEIYFNSILYLKLD